LPGRGLQKQKKKEESVALDEEGLAIKEKNIPD